MRWMLFFAGLVVTLAGLQFSVVDSFVLTPAATETLASWTEEKPGSLPASIRSAVVSNTAPQHVLRPPRWFGWCALSAGCVTLALTIFSPGKK